MAVSHSLIFLAYPPARQLIVAGCSAGQSGERTTTSEKKMLLEIRLSIVANIQVSTYHQALGLY